MEERMYTIPLRREFTKVPRWKRAKKSIIAIKEFASRHMKGKEVKISNKLNELIWSMGGKNTISKVKVKMKKEEDIVYVRLPEEKEEVKKVKIEKTKKKEEKKGEEKKIEKKETQKKSEENEKVEKKTKETNSKEEKNEKNE